MSYKSGDRVLAWDNGVYRPAELLKAADYTKGNCKGWYIQWCDLPKREYGDPLPSQGGWKPENYIKTEGSPQATLATGESGRQEERAQ